MDGPVRSRHHDRMRVTLERLRNWVLEPFRDKSAPSQPATPQAPLNPARIGQWIEGQRTVRWQGPGSAEKIGWVRQAGPLGPDVSARYNQLYVDAKAGKLKLPADAKNYPHLLVGGLFTNQYPGYMDSNQKALKQAGLQVQKVAIDTAASVAVNAAQIRDAVLAATAQGGQVVLIGQSKGGVDISAALALYPELAAKVRSVIAIQAPYGGTPIASDIQTCPELKPIVEGFVGLLKGDRHALTDLSYEAREAFVQAHPYPAQVPTICLASARDSRRSLVDATAAYMRARYNLASDGLVAPDDAVIPGARWVRADNMDHAETVMEGALGFAEHRPGPVTLALVALAHEA